MIKINSYVYGILLMLIKLFRISKTYISIIFLLSIFLISFHHHNDGKIHQDCPICIIQTNITNTDIPQDNIYIVALNISSEAILSNLFLGYRYRFVNSFNSRAPPCNS